MVEGIPNPAEQLHYEDCKYRWAMEQRDTAEAKLAEAEKTIADLRETICTGIEWAFLNRRTGDEPARPMQSLLPGSAP